jgi:hypothetical protein
MSLEIFLSCKTILFQLPLSAGYSLFLQHLCSKQIVIRVLFRFSIHVQIYVLEANFVPFANMDENNIKKYFLDMRAET